MSPCGRTKRLGESPKQVFSQNMSSHDGSSFSDFKDDLFSLGLITMASERKWCLTDGKKMTLWSRDICLRVIGLPWNPGAVLQAGEQTLPGKTYLEGGIPLHGPLSFPRTAPQQYWWSPRKGITQRGHKGSKIQPCLTWKSGLFIWVSNSQLIHMVRPR